MRREPGRVDLEDFEGMENKKGAQVHTPIEDVNWVGDGSKP